MCKWGVVGICDRCLFKGKGKVKKKVLCNMGKEIRGKGFLIFLVCKGVELRVEIEIGFRIGGGVENVRVVDGFVVFECVLKIMDDVVESV